MADARSLLRQQRAIRRIEHPQAAYTDAGKLLCTLCRDQVKAESLWDTHVQSESHRRRLQGRQADAAGQDRADAAAGGKQKRKLEVHGDGVEGEDAVRRKRSKADITDAGTNASDKEASNKNAVTPPSLGRKMSVTPSQGLELRIPSRPATPSLRDTPPSSLASQDPSKHRSLPPRQTQAGSLAPRDNDDQRPSSTAAQVDESEWAAFEADVAAESVPYAEDAVISAPAMNAQESAAAAAAAEASAQNDESRKVQADVDREAEREEAERAMENELEEMHQLEERVQRLKEKREALRVQGTRLGQEAAPEEKPPQGLGNENLEETTVAEGPDEDSGDGGDDDDDDDDDDEWEGFRFRTS